MKKSVLLIGVFFVGIFSAIVMADEVQPNQSIMEKSEQQAKLQEIKSLLEKKDAGGLNPDAKPRVLATADEVEPNDTPSQANSMNIGDSVNGLINSAGDIDYFKFSGAEGQVVWIDIDAWDTGSYLDAVVHVYDSDGVTELDYQDDNMGLDPFFGITLPHAGFFYVTVEDCRSPEGGENYYYSMTLSEAGNVTGMVTDDDGESIYSCDFYVYSMDEEDFMSEHMFDIREGYELLLPAGEYKIYADSYYSTGEWYHRQNRFLPADTVVVAPGGTVSGVDFVLPRSVEIRPRLDQYDYQTGDTVSLTLEVTNGSTPVRLMLAVDLRYPEAGVPTNIYSYYSSPGNRKMIFNDFVVIPADADFSKQIFNYTFNGSEPPGRYRFYVRPMDISTDYGANFNSVSYATSFEFVP